MKLTSAEIQSFKSFFGFKQLMKTILSINHACLLIHNASDSSMTSFRKYVFFDCLNLPSRVAIDKSTVVIGNGKDYSRLRDLSTISPNARQSC